MIDDDEWMHTEPRLPLWACAVLIAVMVLAAWIVAVCVVWGACKAIGP